MPLQTTTQPASEEKTSSADAAARKKGQPEGPRDTTREIFETVVFVVVLVLMLKLFVAEAFVIPTGSMASTLWGDQVRCKCRECGYIFPINVSNGSGDPKNSGPSIPNSYTCQNCGYTPDRDARNDFITSWFSSHPVSSGDRVLVAKYEYHLRDPKRFEVPVFKFPVEPYSGKDRQGMNYIKRLVGLGGETVAVFAGDLYTNRELTYDDEEKPSSEKDAWQFRYMYTKNERAKQAFREGKYQIVRKDPDEIMAVRRLVFDLDNQPATLSGVLRTRWHPDPDENAGWDEAGLKHSGGELGWMRYQHINPWPPGPIGPYYIVDFLGYNAPRDNTRPFTSDYSTHWVSDLTVDCTVNIPSPDAQVVLELAKGPNRFRATFVGGECKLSRLFTTADGKQEIHEMGSHATKMTKGGSYSLRLANFDCRLTVWVDNKPLKFGADQSDYSPPDPAQPFKPFEKNDLLQPARIGARGDVTVSHVSLWRDLLYRCGWESRPRFDPDTPRKDLEPKLEQIPDCGDVQTYYVHPGHFLMFGDNVNSSADSRSWGTVPRRLMLGRAVVIYWPPSRVGVIE